MNQNHQNILTAIREKYGDLSGRGNGSGKKLARALLDGIFSTNDLVAAGANKHTLRQMVKDIEFVNEHGLTNASSTVVSKAVKSHRGRGSNHKNNNNRINRLLKTMHAREQEQQTVPPNVSPKTKPVKKPITGKIYVLSNPYYQQNGKPLYKIGFTTNLLERATDLSKHSGVPGKFDIDYATTTSDVRRFEKLLHDAFKSDRIPGGEFFKADLNDIEDKAQKIKILVDWA